MFLTILDMFVCISLFRKRAVTVHRSWNVAQTVSAVKADALVCSQRCKNYNSFQSVNSGTCVIFTLSGVIESVARKEIKL